MTTCIPALRSSSAHIGLIVRATLWCMLIATPGLARAEDLPAGLRSCMAVADDVRRLACFDREAERLALPAGGAAAALARSPAREPGTNSGANPGGAPAAGGDGVRTAPAAPRVGTPPTLTPEQNFGLTGKALRQARSLAGSADPPPLKSLKAHVVRVLPGAGGQSIYLLDNGQQWQSSELAFDSPPPAGASVTISAGTLGSFWLNTESRSPVKVRRLK